MKIIEGSFGKKESTGRSLSEKITECLDSLGEDATDPESGAGFILITDIDGNIHIASDLPAETFNFVIDTAKMNVLMSSFIGVE